MKERIVRVGLAIAAIASFAIALGAPMRNY
jgi:hypothetical protein